MTETLDAIHFNEYGVKSEVIAESPLRIHLVGEHSWFFGDRTLAVAVSKYAKLSFSKRSDSVVNFFFYHILSQPQAEQPRNSADDIQANPFEYP